MIVSALFTNNTAPVTGLTLGEILLYLYSRRKSDGTVATVWNGVAPTEEVGAGIYTKSYADANGALYDYFAYARYTGATVVDSAYSTMASPAADDAAAFWGHATRTLTSTATEIADAIDGESMTIRKGDTFSATITGLGNIATWARLWFTVKARTADHDDDALIQVVATNPAAAGDGLLYLNGATATAGNGSIVVTDSATGAVLITLAAAATAALPARTKMSADIKVKTAAGVLSTLAEYSETVTIQADVTRAVA